MAIHDWTCVKAGIYHDFHHEWISTIRRTLNAGLLPPDYYALAEQQTGGFGPDVLTLQSIEPPPVETIAPGRSKNGPTVLAPPKTRFTAVSAHELLGRKVSTISIRHVSEDDVVAVIEIVSPGNKTSRRRFETLVSKVCKLLDQEIHLLILDLFPPTKHDPNGLHAAIWEEIAEVTFSPPVEKPLTAVAYESAETIKAYIEPLAVGDAIPDMPLFLEPGAHILVPLDKTYQAAFDTVPPRWRRVLESPSH